MYNYFYISNNQNKLLNKYDENKYYKIGDILEGLPISVSGDSSSINVLNSFVRNYVNNLLIPKPPITYQPRLILDAVLFSGFPQIYNHDLITVGTATYELMQDFMIVYNTDNESTTINFKYIKGLN
ncbi:MAG: hypothetical protein FWE18_00195 [Alphaproteobacteria bacterium]|nr:hypothetical protein [Alphaproteobacteria bacterium]